jgi:hypothetical protein
MISLFHVPAEVNASAQEINDECSRPRIRCTANTPHIYDLNQNHNFRPRMYTTRITTSKWFLITSKFFLFFCEMPFPPLQQSILHIYITRTVWFNSFPLAIIMFPIKINSRKYRKEEKISNRTTNSETTFVKCVPPKLFLPIRRNVRLILTLQAESGLRDIRLT